MDLIRELRQVSRMGLVVAVAAAMVGIIYGYDQSNIAGALHFMQSTNAFQLGELVNPGDPKSELTSAAISRQELTATMVVIGMLIGALFGGALSNRFGRKPSMLAVAATFALFSLAGGLAWDLQSLLVARLLLGLTVGVSLVVVPVFVAESSPAKVRGAMLVLYQFATVFGIICGYLVAWALAGTQSWRLMLGLAAVPAALVLLLLIRIPETARFLVMKGRVTEARDVLVQLDPTQDADEEISEIQQALDSEGAGGAAGVQLLREVVRRPYSRATLFVVGLGFFVQATGINAIVYYTPTIFQKMGFSDSADYALFGLPALVQVAGLLAVFASMSRVDTGGRRQVLLGGIAAMVVANVIMVVTFLPGENISGFGTALGCIGLVLFTAGFSFGFGSVVWVYAGESFPARLRSIGASIMLTADLVANILVAAVFLTLLHTLGPAGTFGLLGVIAVAAFAFAYRFAPETKGRHLDDIRYYWENGGHWPARTAGDPVDQG